MRLSRTRARKIIRLVIKKQLLFIAAGILLVATIAIQFRGQRSATAQVDLYSLLAAAPAGWTVWDLPLGDTEMLQEAAAKTLHYDSYFHRAYRKDGVEFTVYVAYWSPGRHPPQMIAQHVPDRCWPMNGLLCEGMRFNVTTKIGSRALWPAQWRKFRDGKGNPIYTMFWHKVGDRPYDFGSRFYDIPSPFTYWSEALSYVARVQPAQVFFRITASVPLEQIWSEGGFQEAIRGFLVLGLGKPAEGET
jgi:hypothetical protein